MKRKSAGYDASKIPRHVWEAGLITVGLREIELGEGFKLKIPNDDYLAKHGLLGKGVLHFVNNLCILVDEEEDTLPTDEWSSLAYTLNRFMVLHDSGELYYYLLHAHGPEAINFNAWVRFASDMNWPLCVRVFADMPTNTLEEYGVREWYDRTKNMRREDIEVFLKSISKREDIYGVDNLPIEMVEGILFGQNN